MTLREIIRKISRRHGALPDLVGGFVYETLEEVISVLDEGRSVKIRGLGTFQWHPVAERPGTGAKTGSKIQDGVKLRFIPSKRFRSRRTKNVRP